MFGNPAASAASAATMILEEYEYSCVMLYDVVSDVQNLDHFYLFLSISIMIIIPSKIQQE